jgi:hypothetical protein
VGRKGGLILREQVRASSGFGTALARTGTFSAMTALFMSLHVAADTEVLATAFVLALVWLLARV